MSDTICLPKSIFIIIFLIFSIFTYLHTVKMSNIISQQNKTCSPKVIIKEKESNNSELNEIASDIRKLKEINHEAKEIFKKDVLLKRDREAVEDDFKPPERRLPRHNYPRREVKKLINIPTRGYPDNYQNLGILSRKNDEKILKLFGRQKFPGSNQWEYYVVNTHYNDKVPLEIPGNKEIYNGDVIALPWLDQSKGKFEVRIFDYDVPRYNPYI